jgi:hypothetical protein
VCVCVCVCNSGQSLYIQLSHAKSITNFKRIFFFVMVEGEIGWKEASRRIGVGGGRIGVAVCQRVQCRCRELCNFINCEPPPSPLRPSTFLISLLTPNYIPNINFRNLPISTAPQCLVACWTRYKFSRILLYYTGCSKSRHTEITLPFHGSTTLLITHSQQKVTVTVAGANLIAVLPTVAKPTVSRKWQWQ